MGNRRYRIRPLSIYEQAAYMKCFHPGFTCRVKRGQLMCHGVVQPTPLHHRYHVRIMYRVGKPPRAWIEEPHLRRRHPDERIPHTYSDDCPCLYLPGTGEWSPAKKLALTVVPWLSLWLLYYESWLVTGVWQGGGIHPQESSRQITQPLKNDGIKAE
jgi:hypothetical protein